MSILSPTGGQGGWLTDVQAPVRLYLSDDSGDAGALLGARVAGFPFELAISAVTDWIDPAELETVPAAIIQVDADKPASIKRFDRLAAATATPLIAAVYDPPLALVRGLIRAGAHDVIPLPLAEEELQTSLEPIRQQVDARTARGQVNNAKLVTIIKSEGGVGATALLGQLATRFAAKEAQHNREVCLIDFDVQFGDAAFQLGLSPKLTIADLAEAGSRLDGELMRSVMTPHPSGLKILAAPKEIMPLEALSNEQVLAIVERAMREFGTVFVDLPMNWTNWSLSLLARADLVLMVTEMRLVSLHRARRQLDLLGSQDLQNLDVRIVVNRYDKRGLKTVKPADVERVLGRPIAYTIANDHEVMTAAIERGVPIAEIRRKTAIGKDLDLIDAGLVAALGLER